MFEVTEQRFDEIVEEAMRELPPELAGAVENVVVVVERNSASGRLFGLYEGVPLTSRGALSYSGAMPDRITIYQDTISSVCNTEEELVAQVRKTVLHEFAHHFGISDPRLHELGWA